jgi:lipopolysaccharide export system protein LptC
VNDSPAPLPPLRPLSPVTAGRTAPRRSARVWDRVSIYLPVLLMGLMALASYWLLRATPGPDLPRAERPISHEPDYFMRHFSVKVFDANGELTHEIFGAEARHRPDTDNVEIDQARIRSVQPGGLLTTATAQRVTSNGAQTEFVLEGEAVVVREAGRKPDGTALPRLEFRGELLRVSTQPQRLLSERPVSLVRGNDRIQADSLDFTGDDPVIRFQGRVKAYLAPR